MLCVNLQAVVVGDAVIVVVVEGAQGGEGLNTGPESNVVIGVVGGEIRAPGSNVGNIDHVFGAELVLQLQIPFLHLAVLVILVHGDHAQAGRRAVGIEAYDAAGRKRRGHRRRAGVAVAIVAAINGVWSR